MAARWRSRTLRAAGPDVDDMLLPPAACWAALLAPLRRRALLSERLLDGCFVTDGTALLLTRRSAAYVDYLLFGRAALDE